jgi:hypothetical protein
VIPLTWTSDPLTVAEETVTDPLLAVSVPVWLCELPTTTLPKLTLEGVSANWPGDVPVPESGTETVPVDAFELIERVPPRVPVAFGANITVKVALWPPPKVKGGLIPLMLKPVPLTAVCDMVTAELPILKMVSDIFLLLPAMTFPKLKLDGFADSCPDVVPVPESGTKSARLGALLRMETFPLTLPLDCGPNLTVKLTL